LFSLLLFFLQRGGHATIVVLETFLNVTWIGSFEHVQM